MTDLDEFADGDAVIQSAAKLITEQRHHARTRRELARAQERVEHLEQLLDRYQVVSPADMKVPRWTTRKASKRSHRATALLMLSDLHLDEVVDAGEMSGMNEYDRAIAERRLEAVIDGTVKLTSTYVAGVQWDGIVQQMPVYAD